MAKKSSKKTNSTNSNYRLNFKGQKITLEKLFGKTPIAMTDIQSIMWKYIKSTDGIEMGALPKHPLTGGLKEFQAFWSEIKYYSELDESEFLDAGKAIKLTKAQRAKVKKVFALQSKNNQTPFEEGIEILYDEIVKGLKEKINAFRESAKAKIEETDEDDEDDEDEDEE